MVIHTLQEVFEENRNPEIAAGQKAYMRNQFEFLGIKTPLRKALQKPFLRKDSLPPKNELHKIVKTLWKKPEREYQYFAQELVQKYMTQLEKKDILLFEFMITHKSWWDTVDAIATKPTGAYFKTFPEERDARIAKWIASDNLWLQRTAILFQLNYKEELDTDFLSYVINALIPSDEFFINKAIGWILRQYSKTHPQWVLDFAERTPLSPLSQREGLRLILH